MLGITTKTCVLETLRTKLLCKRLGVCLLVLIGVGCSSNSSQTLGSLKYEEDKEKEIEFEKLSHEQVRNEYKELIDLFEDKKLKERIERRIADVYMMEAVDVPSDDGESSEYVEAIKAYRNILERYPDSPDNAEVFYQLAKAYDLEGQQDEAMNMLTELVRRHPTYKNIAEAHFRKADIHFNWQQYNQAKVSYEAVTRLTEGRLRINAHYMLGWVYYKELNFGASVDAFAFVMNSILTAEKTFETLDKAEKPLIEDSINSISLALDKLGGAEAISEFDSIHGRPYVWRLYDHMGDYYLEKELYEQSAQTFRHYVRNFPAAVHAPRMHEKLINAYIDGKFPREAMREKERYVASYGITSRYPGNENGIQKPILTLLKVYLDELALFTYGEGQAYFKEIGKEKKANKDRADKTKLKKFETKGIEAFTRSAGFYGEFIDTFPQDVRVDEMRFLKAEAHYQARQYLDAAADYELVAYQPVGKSANDKAADSGYAAIISYQNYIDGLRPKKHKKKIAEYRAVAVESMLRFSKAFDSDKRSPSVLTNAAEYLFGLNQYERAIAVAEDLVSDESTDKTLLKTAYGIMAHSQFKLQRFDEAETSYVNQRSYVKAESQEYKDITERIAAAVFKHAEVVEKEQGKLAAANQLLKLKNLAPNSPIRITAQYDAATLFLGLSEWSKAIVEFKQLMALYPDHELAPEFPRKIALAYQKNEEWVQAADAYLYLYTNDADPEIQREGLFLAASMFEKAGDYDAALKYFKRYAYDYEKPFDRRMEARYHMALNYETIGEVGKQLYWLRRIVQGDAQGGEDRSERSRWLGAWANAKYGDYFAEEFRKKRLRNLTKHLPKKKEFYESATQRYERAASYGFLEFVTMSSYKIGGLSESFAQDLRQAPSPKGLSASDRVLYGEIIEDQAQPFDQLAMDVYQANIDRAWEGGFNEWIGKSFDALKRLNPQRFNKEEVSASYGELIR
ncbi:MAG: tetratricopeptide repeat protein [Agarilytica sp.]